MRLAANYHSVSFKPGWCSQAGQKHVLWIDRMGWFSWEDSSRTLWLAWSLYMCPAVNACSLQPCALLAAAIDCMLPLTTNKCGSTTLVCR